MGHQDAQTLTKVGLPRRSANESRFPSSVSPLSSTAAGDPASVLPEAPLSPEPPPQAARVTSKTTRSGTRCIDFTVSHDRAAGTELLSPGMRSQRLQSPQRP